MKKSELRKMIKELVNEMWIGWEEEEENTPVGVNVKKEELTGRSTEPGSDQSLVDLYKGDKKGHPDSLPSVGGAMSEASDYATMMKKFGGVKCPKCKKFHPPGDKKLRVLSPSNPTIYQCEYCGHMWNPANVKSTVQNVGDKSFVIESGNQHWKNLYEAKGTTPKDKLKNLVLEVMDEMGDEAREGREIQIGKEILKLVQLVGTNNNPEAWDIVEKLKKLAKELIDIHEKSASLPKQKSLKRSLQYKHGKPVDGMKEVAPPGWEKTVKGMKKHKDIDNPWALAWSMKNKGMTSHGK